MTWGNRIRMLLGLVVTLAIVAACTLVFTQRQHTAQSRSATIMAQTYPVGTDYGGIVTRQYVDEGDRVAAGDPLFEVRSLQLQRDVASGYVDEAALTAQGTTIVTATVDGTVSDIRVPQGGFAQAGGVLAGIDRSASLFVEAEFTLSPRDYARISAGAAVELLLPNQSVLDAAVDSIDVQTADGQAQSTIRITSAALTAATATGLFQPGTPVTATLSLRDDGPFAGLSDALHDVVRKIGL